MLTGLASLSVGYDLSPSFDYRVLYYDITVPYEVTSIKYRLYVNGRSKIPQNKRKQRF